DEERIVFKAGANTPTTGLVPSAPGLRGLLKGFRAVPNGIDQEARAQNGSVLFVSFSKGRFPRFCNIRKTENGEFDVYPKDAKNDFQFLTKEAWDFIIDESKSGDRHFYKSTSCEILMETPSTTKKVRISELERTVTDLQNACVWYIGLP